MLVGGVSLGVVGMLWLSTISADAHYFPQIAVPMVILGVGMGIALVPLVLLMKRSVAEKGAHIGAE